MSDDRPERPAQDPYATAPLPPTYGPPTYEQPPSPFATPPQGPPVPPPTDVVSVVALVTSVIGALIASVPLGIIGLVRTKDRRRGARWAAVTALALSAAWVVVGVVVFALLGSSTAAGGAALGGASAAPSPSSLFPSDTPSPVAPTTTPTPTPTPTPTATIKPAKVVTHKVYIGFVTKGHCFDEPKKGSSFVPELTTCRAPHDEEMMGTVQLGSGRYPGTTAARTRADAACQKMFATFVGVPTDESELGLETWWPSAGLWGSGKHIAQCAVHSSDGRTVGTLRGSQR